MQEEEEEKGQAQGAARSARRHAGPDYLKQPKQQQQQLQPPLPFAQRPRAAHVRTSAGTHAHTPVCGLHQRTYTPICASLALL
jgi:hypothetical protein